MEWNVIGWDGVRNDGVMGQLFRMLGFYNANCKGHYGSLKWDCIGLQWTVWAGTERAGRKAGMESGGFGMG